MTSRRLGAALLLAAAWLILGCADGGYPTEDIPSIHPAEMNQAQRLAMMNALGKRPHLPRRWRYGLAEGCRLTIDEGASRSAVVSLQGAAIKTVSGEAQGKFTVLLLPPDQGPADTVVVIVGARWLDLVQIRSLLDQIPRAC